MGHLAVNQYYSTSQTLHILAHFDRQLTENPGYKKVVVASAVVVIEYKMRNMNNTSDHGSTDWHSERPRHCPDVVDPHPLSTHPETFSVFVFPRSTTAASGEVHQPRHGIARSVHNEIMSYWLCLRDKCKVSWSVCRYVAGSVGRSVHVHISETARPKCTKLSVHITSCGCGLVL